MGAPNPRGASGGSAPARLFGGGARTGEDARSIVERGAEGDAPYRPPARVPPQLLGEEDPGVDAAPGGGSGDRDPPERPLPARRPRSERVCEHRLGDRG